MFNSKSNSTSNELVARWKSVIDESNPAGLIELDDLDNFLGGTVPVKGSTSGCSTTATACCTCIGGTSCC